MTATEMFEELGYKCITFNFNGIRETIKFYKPNNNYSSNVIFDLTNKMFRVYCSEDDGAGYVDMKLLKTINKQIEELGWLDEQTGTTN